MDTKVLFRVPIFDIAEQDGLNTARIERSFRQAVLQMYQRNGFYISFSREFCYTLHSRLLENKENNQIFAFGKKLKIDTPDLDLSLYPSHFIKKIEDWKEQGFSEIVFNERLKDGLPYTDNVQVYPESLMFAFINRKKLSTVAELLVQDYTVELIGAEVVEPGFSTVAEAIAALVYAPRTVIGFKLIQRSYFSDGTIQRQPVSEIYYQDLIVTREWALKNLNPSLIKALKPLNRKVFVLTNGGVYVPAPEFLMMKDNSPKSWLRCIKFA